MAVGYYLPVTGKVARREIATENKSATNVDENIKFQTSE